jgi:hypothetical protein
MKRSPLYLTQRSIKVFPDPLIFDKKSRWYNKNCWLAEVDVCLFAAPVG